MAEMRVAGRRVILVKDQQTQTINVCDESGAEGSYDWTVRFPSDTPVQAEVERTRATHGSVEALVLWLKNSMAGTVERVPPDQDVLPTTRWPASPDPDPATSVAVREALEESLDGMVTDFLARPYLHRREHNLHATLCRRLKGDPRVPATVRLDGGEEADLLQQEWPELDYRQRLGSFHVNVMWPLAGSTVGPHLRKGRGRYDLAILSPAVMAACGPKRYLDGTDAPLFVVEFGLIEDYDHLRADAAKLVNNRVPFGYLVHFCRPEKVDNFAAVERLLEMLCANSPVRSVYARVERRAGRMTYHFKLSRENTVRQSDDLP